MSALNIHAILERAGADASAPEGSQAWALAQVDVLFAEVADALTRALPAVEHMYHTSPALGGPLWDDVVVCRAAVKACEGAK